MSPSKKATAIRLELHAADTLGVRNDHVNRVDWLLAGRARTAASHNRITGRNEFRFDEEIAESRVRCVRGRRSEDRFGIACQFDFADPC